MIFFLMALCLLPMLLMFCISVGMGRVWSLYFMLQIVSNFDNFSELKLPAHVQYFLSMLENISNFKISEIHEMFTLALGEMPFSFLLYWFIFGSSWMMWKTCFKSVDRRGMRKILIWSPLLRCLLMTWFGAALYEMTFIFGAFDGFKSKHINLRNPRVIGKGNNLRRNLVGLDTRYPTEPETSEYHHFILPVIIGLLVSAFPVYSLLWLRRNHQNLQISDLNIKYGTLYTDLKTHKVSTY